VLVQLRARHVTVAQYRTTSSNPAPVPVPLNWHVYDAIPWAPGQVLLVVGRSANDALPRPPARVCSLSNATTAPTGPGTATTPTVCRAPGLH
jgi:hypothetical protein